MFSAHGGLPQILGHIINPLTAGHHTAIPAPPQVMSVDQVPVVDNCLLRMDGLLDVHSAGQDIVCPSVFSPTKWVRRQLFRPEFLQVWDVPLSLDNLITLLVLPDVGCSVTLLVLSAIVRRAWLSNGQFTSVGG